MSLKKNGIITLDITDITNLGFGVGKADGEVVFVAGAVPGDTVICKIIKLTSSYAVAHLQEFLKRSPIRTDKRCKNTVCRSCAYKCLDYEYEKKLKEGVIKTAFKKCGLPGINVLPLVSSPKESGYRNKAQYPISKNKNGDFQIGFYAPKSHRVTEAADCTLAPIVFGEIAEALRAFFKKHDFDVYDESTGSGLLRHIYLRRGDISGEILVTLVINGTSLPYSNELVKELSSRFPEICGILLNINQKNTNVILGGKFITLYGDDYITDTLGGVKLKITAPSFYQVNHDAAELLYAKAKELASPTKNDTILDLYCGAGSIGLSMAKDAGEVIGIEIVPSAVECAKFNAMQNGITNANFYTGDASDAERILDTAEEERGKKICPDIIILDPPRSGSDEKLLRHIVKLNPKKIIYISCNPQTLARDVAILNGLNYCTNSVTPFDLFPMTGHVESVVCLTRK